MIAERLMDELKNGTVEILAAPVILAGGVALESVINGANVGGLVASTVVIADGFRRISKVELET